MARPSGSPPVRRCSRPRWAGRDRALSNQVVRTGTRSRRADAQHRARPAPELAVEQAVPPQHADSFVNLGRRNQNLLARQLDLITQLENASSLRLPGQPVPARSPAARMRRNAESLLVLAGIDPPRQCPARSVSDVVRAALGEVEDYQRVAVRRPARRSSARSR